MNSDISVELNNLLILEINRYCQKQIIEIVYEIMNRTISSLYLVIIVDNLHGHEGIQMINKLYQLECEHISIHGNLPQLLIKLVDSYHFNIKLSSDIDNLYVVDGQIQQYEMSIGYNQIIDINPIIQSLQVDPQWAHIINAINKTEYQKQEYHQYNRLVMGGTFDNLHPGHKLLLFIAKQHVKPNGYVYIGLSADQLLINKKYKYFLQNYQFRFKQLKQYLQFIDETVQWDIQQLTDIYGPTLHIEFDRCVVSKETENSMELINKERQNINKTALKHIVVDLIVNENSQINTKISSSQIRQHYSNCCMTVDYEELKQRWNKMCSQICEDQSLIDKWGWLVLRLYCESHRYYHTINHVNDMLVNMDQYLDQVQDRLVLELAIWFHDVIYQYRGTQNENKSIQLFQKFIQDINNYHQSLEILNQSQYHKVIEYIQSTINHCSLTDEQMYDPDLLFFLDLDLSILASECSKYQQYSHNIRKEYQYIEWAIYCNKRSQILKDFKQQNTNSCLFRSKQYQSNIKIKQRVEQNLDYEIKILTDE